MIDKIKKTLTALAPVVTAVSAIWGLDIAAIVSATSVFLTGCLEYAKFWVEYKKTK